MNIIIPMAGEGRRFVEKGYKISKPAIPTTDRRTGKLFPMVICATMDLPGVEEDGNNVIYIDRDFHQKADVENKIREYYPNAKFITIDKLTEGQACTCLLAKNIINNDESLLIAGCDNGMVIDLEKFEKMTSECDVLVFTYRHNQSVLLNPDAYGWMKVDNETNKKIIGVSVKKAISNTPMEEHAVVATFWFKKGIDFVKAAEKMIREDDRVNGEFYVDKVIKHCLDIGFDTRVFEIERYIGWGTPKDYEDYENTIRYWRRYVKEEFV